MEGRDAKPRFDYSVAVATLAALQPDKLPRKANRPLADIVTRPADDLRDVASGTVAVSGMTYAKHTTAASEGSMYRAAVGAALGFGLPISRNAYPLSALVREVSVVLPLLQKAAIAEDRVKPLTDDADAATRTAYEEAVAAAIDTRVPAAYLLEGAGSRFTWLLRARDIDATDDAADEDGNVHANN